MAAVRRVVEPSEVVEMVNERLLAYGADEIVRFWQDVFANDPTLELNDEGEIVATYDDDVDLILEKDD